MSVIKRGFFTRTPNGKLVFFAKCFTFVLTVFSRSKCEHTWKYKRKNKINKLNLRRLCQFDVKSQRQLSGYFQLTKKMHETSSWLLVVWKVWNRTRKIFILLMWILREKLETFYTTISTEKCKNLLFKKVFYTKKDLNSCYALWMSSFTFFTRKYGKSVKPCCLKKNWKRARQKFYLYSMQWFKISGFCSRSILEEQIHGSFNMLNFTRSFVFQIRNFVFLTGKFVFF
jgi:hypothetical protein